MTADSTLVNETHWLTTHYSERNSGSKITDICIHHFAGNITDLSYPYQVWQNREASAHYAISSDGRIGQYVPESKKAWACVSGNSQTINIELADDVQGGANSSSGWHTSDEAIEACIKLVADIAKRRGWSSVTFDGANKATGNHNIVCHKWFSATLCPCDYVYSKLPYIAEQANKILKGEDDDMTDAEFAKKMETYLNSLANKEPSDNSWIKTNKTMEIGKDTYEICDGKRPYSYVTRAECVQMIIKAIKYVLSKLGGDDLK